MLTAQLKELERWRHDEKQEHLDKKEFYKKASYPVRIAVRGRSPVLKIAVALLGHLPWDPDGAASIGHPGREVVDGRSLVGPGQPPFVILKISHTS